MVFTFFFLEEENKRKKKKVFVYIKIIVKGENIYISLILYINKKRSSEWFEKERSSYLLIYIKHVGRY